tara:strand:+ start:138 stop:317 length:180 start_codon:yes stop_codon:yes gene_type:complete
MVDLCGIEPHSERCKPPSETITRPILVERVEIESTTVAMQKQLAPLVHASPKENSLLKS